jgi:hypothetical protein
VVDAADGDGRGADDPRDGDADGASVVAVPGVWALPDVRAAGLEDRVGLAERMRLGVCVGLGAGPVGLDVAAGLTAD